MLSSSGQDDLPPPGSRARLDSFVFVCFVFFFTVVGFSRQQSVISREKSRKQLLPLNNQEEKERHEWKHLALAAAKEISSSPASCIRVGCHCACVRVCLRVCVFK